MHEELKVEEGHIRPFTAYRLLTQVETMNMCLVNSTAGQPHTTKEALTLPAMPLSNHQHAVSSFSTENETGYLNPSIIVCGGNSEKTMFMSSCSIADQQCNNAN